MLEARLLRHAPHPSCSRVLAGGETPLLAKPNHQSDSHGTAASAGLRRPLLGAAFVGRRGVEEAVVQARRPLLGGCLLSVPPAGIATSLAAAGGSASASSPVPQAKQSWAQGGYRLLESEVVRRSTSKSDLDGPPQ